MGNISVNASDFGMVPTDFKCGSTLVRENDVSRQMFIICSGKARVYKQHFDRRITLAILGQGEIFGELSFFDAEPRSASVEALTDLSTLVIDANEASKQIAGLPTWVIPIFRTAFGRLREADRRITVLESRNDFKKRNFNRDETARTIYSELTRFFKTLRLLYDTSTKAKPNQPVNSAELQKELDQMLGGRSISLRYFWRTLKEHEFINNHLEESQNSVALNLPHITEFEKYLDAERHSEQYLLLGHPAIAIARRIIAKAKSDSSPSTENKTALQIAFDDIGLTTLPLYEEGLTELTKYGLLTVTKQFITFDPKKLYAMYVHQSIIKTFDHTISALD